MKKTLVAALIGLATVSSVLAQGKIIMYNYGNNPITYGAGVGPGSGNIANGTPAATTWTIAMYGVAGNSVATINGLLAGDGGYGLVGGVGGLTLATGTATITGDGVFGAALPPTSATFNFSGVGSFVLVAYNGSSYDLSSIRGHSAAFSMTAQASPNSPEDLTLGQHGSFSVFNVAPVPEPSTFALAGLGLAGLLIFRRRK